MLKPESILAARARIAPFVRRTPLVHSAYLSARTGGEVWLKAECLQPTGSFKVRGAVNKVGLLSAEERARGIGAELEVSSTPGQGSTVTVRLAGSDAQLPRDNQCPST